MGCYIQGEKRIEQKEEHKKSATKQIRKVGSAIRMVTTYTWELQTEN